MKRYGLVVLLFSAWLTACASAAPTTNAPATGMRHRPRRSTVNRVLGDAVQRAAGCIPPTVQQITVTGAFTGATGEFRVENITSPTPIGTSVRACVRQEFETARIDPFIADRFEASRTLGPEGEINPDGGAPADAASTVPVADASAGPTEGASDATVASTVSDASTTPDAETVATRPPPDAAVAPPPATTPATGTQNTRHPAVATPVEAGPVSRASIIGCYRGVTHADPTVGGRVRLRFTVTLDGAAQGVHAALIGTPTGRPMLMADALRCIEQHVARQTFPHSAAGDSDLILTLAPGRAGGDISIERATLGVLSTAPGTGPAESNGTTASGNATGPTVATGAGGAPAATPDQLRDVSGVLRGRVDDVRGCYQQQLTRDNSLQVNVRVRFVIQPNGSVSNSSSTTAVTAGDPDAATAVAQCMEALVRSMTFPTRSGDAIEAAVPFRFAPSTPAPGPIGPTGAGGRIDPARTSDAIRGHTAAIRECYTRALVSDPTLAGRVIVRFTVDYSGRVLNASSQVSVVSGAQVRMQAVAQCVQDVLGTIQLPAPTGGSAQVALPFDFGPTQ